MREKAEAMFRLESRLKNTIKFYCGEQQRGQRRVLCHRATTFFADEPTGSLDAATGEAVISIDVRNLTVSVDLPCLVTHDMFNRFDANGRT